MVWISVMVFVVGSFYRLLSLAALAAKKDRTAVSYFQFRYACRSIGHWIIPFAAISMRRHPVMTMVSFLFHICIIVTPLFLLEHMILIKESWNVSWWFLPDMIADAMTLMVIGSCLFFIFRRIILPEARYLTTASDYILLVLVAAPFISGFWAVHQWPGYVWASLFHIVSGEILLIAIPFTRLGHMLFFPLTRGYMGSEFGGVRKAKDW